MKVGEEGEGKEEEWGNTRKTKDPRGAWNATPVTCSSATEINTRARRVHRMSDSFRTRWFWLCEGRERELRVKTSAPLVSAFARKMRSQRYVFFFFKKKTIFNVQAKQLK